MKLQHLLKRALLVLMLVFTVSIARADAVTIVPQTNNLGSSEITGISIADIVPVEYTIGTINTSENTITWLGLSIVCGSSAVVTYLAPNNDDESTVTTVPMVPKLTLQKEGAFTDENSDGLAQVGAITYMITQVEISVGDVDNMATATRKCPKGNNVTDQSEDPTPMTPIDPSCSDCTTGVTG